MDTVPERPRETIEVINEHLTIRRIYDPDPERCVAAVILLLKAGAERTAREQAALMQDDAEAER